MHAQQLGHLVREEVELPSRDYEFFAKRKFRHIAPAEQWSGFSAQWSEGRCKAVSGDQHRPL